MIRTDHVAAVPAATISLACVCRALVTTRRADRALANAPDGDRQVAAFRRHVSLLAALDPKLPSVCRDLAFENPHLVFLRHWRKAPAPGLNPMAI